MPLLLLTRYLTYVLASTPLAHYRGYHTQAHKYYQPKSMKRFTAVHIYIQSVSISCINLMLYPTTHSLPCFLSEQGLCPVFLPLLIACQTASS